MQHSKGQQETPGVSELILEAEGLDRPLPCASLPRGIKELSHASAHLSPDTCLVDLSPDHEPGTASLCPTPKFYFLSCFRHKQPSPSYGLD